MSDGELERAEAFAQLVEGLKRYYKLNHAQRDEIVRLLTLTQLLLLTDITQRWRLIELRKAEQRIA